MLTKTLKFDDDVLGVIKSMEWADDGCLGVITGGQLARDLYIRVNKALEAMGGKWDRKAGGHVFKLDPRSSVDGLLENGSLAIERDGFFETPDAVIDRMFELVPPPSPGPLVLEPSAGLGAIARRLVGQNLTLVEKNEQRCGALRTEFKNVICADFLSIECGFGGNYYDYIYMNPPFEELQDTDHIKHAYQCLAHGCALVSVVSESPFFHSSKKAVAFREWLDKLDYITEKLPVGSFKESGTGVNARLIVMRKPLLI